MKEEEKETVRPYHLPEGCSAEEAELLRNANTIEDIRPAPRRRFKSAGGETVTDETFSDDISDFSQLGISRPTGDGLDSGCEERAQRYPDRKSSFYSVSESDKSRPNSRVYSSQVKQTLRKGKNASKSAQMNDGDNISVTVTTAPSFDEVQAELDRIMNRRDTENRIPSASLPGRSATLNTPISTTSGADYPFNRSQPRTRKSVKSSIASPTRNRIYKRAMTLMSTRCNSSVRNQNTANSFPIYVKLDNDSPIKHRPQSYFYVVQKRPLPDHPLKVWQGYHGNVYFEPLVCKQLETPRAGALSQSRKLRSDSKSVTFDDHYGISERKGSRLPSIKSNKKPNFVDTLNQSGQRKMAILDKMEVLKKMDGNIQEDVKWIAGLEGLGSLQVGHNFQSALPQKYDKTKICRGFTNPGQLGKTDSQLKVSGGQVVTRSQTQTARILTAQKQSQAESGRGTMESQMQMRLSPDLSRYTNDQLPTLEQLNARFKSYSSGSGDYIHRIPSYEGEKSAESAIIRQNSPADSLLSPSKSEKSEQVLKKTVFST